MAQLTTIDNLLMHCVKDLYSAETQLLDALPLMAEAATEPALSEAFLTHLAETRTHVGRLEKIADLLGDSPHGVACAGMQGLISEGQEIIEADGDATVKDLALIGAARKVEHYEVAAYCGAKGLAEALGNLKVVSLLQTTEDEETASDKILVSLAAKVVGGAPTADSLLS